MVDFNRPDRLRPEERPQSLGQPTVIEPGPPVPAGVDAPQCIPQSSLQEYLPERRTPSNPRIRLRPLDMRPAQPPQLLHERKLHPRILRTAVHFGTTTRVRPVTKSNPRPSLTRPLAARSSSPPPPRI